MKARLLDFYQAGRLTSAYEEEVGSWLAILLDAEEAHVRVPDRRLAICSLNCDTKQLTSNLQHIKICDNYACLCTTRDTHISCELASLFCTLSVANDTHRDPVSPLCPDRGNAI